MKYCTAPKGAWLPMEFEELGAAARELGFAQVRSGPLVRSSYHAADHIGIGQS